METEIASDASITTVLEGADYLVLGADKVLHNGNISNKIESLTAAMLVKTMSTNRKTVTVFDTGKVSWMGDIPKTGYNDPTELTNVWPSKGAEQVKEDQPKGFKIQVKNANFEWAPHESERGLLDDNGIGDPAAEGKALGKRLFSDL